MTSTNARLACLVGGSILLIAGCAGPGPRLFPPAPVQVQSVSGGGFDRWYDTDNDGKPDYREQYSAEGMLTAIGYDRDQDDTIEDTVVLDQVPEQERRYLVLLLDSVPYPVADELWQQGRFRYCPHPSRIIPPFPVMTDLSFTEFFGASPSPGIESEYYDGKHLKGGYWVYLQEGNANWLPYTDYHMPQSNHGNAYLNIEPWYAHELRKIEHLFLRSNHRITIGYCVGTSAMGAMQAWNGHQVAMNMVDRLCQELIYQTRGRARFALFSDHGHFFTPEESRRLPLGETLQRMGYHVADRIRGPRDLVIPEFEMVSAASIWTQTPARVAADVVGIEGVDLAAYMEGEQLMVLNRQGQAVITRSAAGFKYLPISGDPLQMSQVLHQLRPGAAADGFFDDRALFEATLHHVYPDGIARLWRAFHGLVANTPNVIVSLVEGYHCGSKLQTEVVNIIGVHGNLRQASSSGFVMSSAGGLPADIRMEDLRAALRASGVPFNVPQTRPASEVTWAR